jgi:hypothetical protein
VVRSLPGRSRSFSVNVATGRYHCHCCRRHGYHLYLWATAAGLPQYQAAIDLFGVLGRDVPWSSRW